MDMATLAAIIEERDKDDVVSLSSTGSNCKRSRSLLPDPNGPTSECMDSSASMDAEKLPTEKPRWSDYPKEEELPDNLFDGLPFIKNAAAIANEGEISEEELYHRTLVPVPEQTFLNGADPEGQGPLRKHIEILCIQRYINDANHPLPKEKRVMF
jgi:hypothetical protein